MKKYKMVWTDSTLTDDFPAAYFDRDGEEPIESASKEAIATIEKHISEECFNIPVTITLTADMGDSVDFDCAYEFGAESDADLLLKVNTLMNVCGRDIHCFSVLDDAGEVVLTEEDLVD